MADDRGVGVSPPRFCLGCLKWDGFCWNRALLKPSPFWVNRVVATRCFRVGLAGTKGTPTSPLCLSRRARTSAGRSSFRIAKHTPNPLSKLAGKSFLQCDDNLAGSSARGFVPQKRRRKLEIPRIIRTNYRRPEKEMRRIWRYLAGKCRIAARVNLIPSQPHRNALARLCLRRHNAMLRASRFGSGI